MVETLRFIDEQTFSRADFVGVQNDIFGTNFVIPEQFNDLNVLGTTGGVIVVPGSAVVGGMYYHNTTSKTLSVANNPTNPRIDAVIVEVNTTNKTARLAIQQGTPAATPAYPSVSGIDKLLLAYLYIPVGFTGASTLSQASVYDQRIFFSGPPIHGRYVSENLVCNAENLAWNGSTNPPEYWYNHTGSPTWSNAGGISSTARGNNLLITNASGSVAALRIPAPNTGFIVENTKMFTFKTSIQLNAATSITINLVALHGVSSETVLGTRTINLTSSTSQSVIIRFELSSEQLTTLRAIDVRFSGDTAVSIGQCILVRGYVPGPPRQKHETIMFTNQIEDANFNTTAMPDNTSQFVNLSTAYGGNIKRGTRAVFGRIFAADTLSTSGAGNNVVEIRSAEGGGAVARLNLVGVPDNAGRGEQFVVGLNTGAAYGFNVYTDVRGTLTLYMVLLGIVT